MRFLDKNIKIIGLIPCAGEGKRLNFPYPKEMFPDLRKKIYMPIFMDIFGHMSKITNDIVVVVNNQRGLLKKYLRAHCPKGINIHFVLQEKPVSLPHAILQAYPLIKNKNVLFGMPDTIITDSKCFEIIYRTFMKDNFDLICGCFKVNRPQDFGAVEFYKSGLIRKFKDKPKKPVRSKWIWGILAWSPNFSRAIKNNFKANNYNLTDDTMNLFTRDKKALGIKFKDSRYYDMGTIQNIREFINKEIL